MTLLQHGSQHTAASTELPCPPGNTSPAQRELCRLRMPKTPGKHPDLGFCQHRQELLKSMRLWLCTSGEVINLTTETDTQTQGLQTLQSDNAGLRSALPWGQGEERDPDSTLGSPAHQLLNVRTFLGKAKSHHHHSRGSWQQQAGGMATPSTWHRFFLLY